MSQSLGSGSFSTREVKRVRQTISCLNCKKRKVKCDKTRPCLNCRNRNEIDLCEFQNGYISIPQNYVPFEQFQALQKQVQRLEDRLPRNTEVNEADTATRTPTLGRTNSIYPDRNDKTTVLERALLSIDVLSEDRNPDPLSSHLEIIIAQNPMSTAQWPNILSPRPPEERPSRWRNAMLANLAAIPEKEILDSLVLHYFTKIDFFWHAIHQQVFTLELAQFHSLRQTGNSMLVDPGWLALLIAITDVAVHSLFGGDFANAAFDPGVDITGFEDTGAKLDLCLESSLLCAGTLHNPQMRVVQALVVLLNRMQVDKELSLYEGRSFSSAETLWLDLGISQCKGLKLHILGSNFERDPPSDPAFPPGATLYAREMASRVVHLLGFWDQISACVVSSHESWNDPFPFRFHPGSVTTPRPKNIRDGSLYPLGSLVVDPQPMFIKTEVVWQIHLVQIASQWARIARLLSDASNLTVDMVKHVDAELRTGMQDLLSMKMSSRLTVPEDIAAESLLGRFSSYNQRVIRVHRRFFLRSYSEPAYQFSQSAALTAARHVIQGHQSIVARYGKQIPVQQAVVFHAHHVSANVILFVHGCLFPSDKAQVRMDISTYVDLFEQATFSCYARWAQGVGYGSRLVKLLLKALDNPPQTLQEIETFLLDIQVHSQRDAHPSVGLEHATPSEVLQTPTFITNTLWPPVGALDESTNADFDWDSLFRGF